MQSIGVSSEETFPNSSFSALSSSSGNEAYKGRLNGAGAWSPSTDSNANDYLQINLKYEFVICAVATQGKPTANGWTEEYKLNLSLSGINWDTYQENNIDKVHIWFSLKKVNKSLENSAIIGEYKTYM